MKIFYFVILPIAALVIILFFIFRDNGVKIDNADIAGLSSVEAKVYMSPTCGCCSLFESMLSKKMKTKKILVDDMDSIKKQYNIPKDLQSCHTTIVGGYAIEGHIPIEAIAKLLKEKPAIQGIAMPGMPSGSPGMPGPKNDPFEIYKLDNSNSNEIFMTI